MRKAIAGSVLVVVAALRRVLLLFVTLTVLFPLALLSLRRVMRPRRVLYQLLPVLVGTAKLLASLDNILLECFLLEVELLHLFSHVHCFVHG